MRVSPVALYAKTLDETLLLAKASAEVTHDHPEGIKGACATAGAIFLAKTGESKETIRKFIEKYYDLSFTIDAIRPFYRFNETCQGSVPEALLAFLESDSYEDTVRTAISIGGDSDTVAAIAGGVAEAFYGIPKSIEKKAFHYLDTPLSSVVKDFYKKYSA
jgi:type I restriction enzyme M protein